MVLKNKTQNPTQWPSSTLYATSIAVTVTDPDHSPLINAQTLTDGSLSVSGSGSTAAFDITITVAAVSDASTYTYETTQTISVSGLNSGITKDLGTVYVGCHREPRKVLLKCTNTTPSTVVPNDWFSVIYKPTTYASYVKVSTKRQYSGDISRIEVDLDYVGGSLYVVPNGAYDGVISQNLTSPDTFLMSSQITISQISAGSTDVDDLTYDIIGFIFPSQTHTSGLQLDFNVNTMAISTGDVALYKSYTDIGTVVGDDIGFFFNRSYTPTDTTKKITASDSTINVTSTDDECFNLSVSIYSLLMRYGVHKTHTGSHYLSSCIALTTSITEGDYITPEITTKSGTLTPSDATITSIDVTLTSSTRYDNITITVSSPSSLSFPYATGYSASIVINANATNSEYWCNTTSTIDLGVITGNPSADITYKACQFEFALAYPPSTAYIKATGENATAITSDSPVTKIYPSTTDLTKIFTFSSSGYSAITATLTGTASNLRNTKTSYTIALSGTATTYSVSFTSNFDGSPVTGIPVYGGLTSASTYVGVTPCTATVLANNNYFWKLIPDDNYKAYPVCCDQGMVTGQPQSAIVNVVGNLYEEGKVGITSGVSGAQIFVTNLSTNVQKNTSKLTTSSEVFVYPALYFGDGHTSYSDAPASYQITLTHPSKSDYTATVTLKPSVVKHVSATFVDGTGNATFIVTKSTAPDFSPDKSASIYIDGGSIPYSVDASTGICSVIGLSVGGHTYQVTSGDCVFTGVGNVAFTPEEGSLVIEKGSTTSVTVNLKYFGYVKMVNSLGYSVTGYFNADSVGSTFPKYILNQDDGSYSWYYLKDGKKTASGTAVVSAGTRTVIDPGQTGVKFILSLPSSDDFTVTGEASVYLNGSTVASGTCDSSGVCTIIGLTEGVHSYSIQKSGVKFGDYGTVSFYSVAGVFTAKLGETVTVTESVQYYGYIKIVTKPQSGYYIKFNNSMTTHTTPYYIINQDPGTWTYSLHTADEYQYLITSGTCTVTKNARTLIDAEIPTSPVFNFGKFVLKSVPTGATVSLDPTHNNGAQTLIGTTPTTYTAGYGDVYFIFEKDGYVNQVVTGTRAIGEDTPVTCSFEAAYGTLTVTSSPAGATVLIDGITKGTTPYSNSATSTGKHTVTLKKTGYNNYSTSVNLAYNGTATVSYTMKLKDPRRGNICTSDTLMF